MAAPTAAITGNSGAIAAPSPVPAPPRADPIPDALGINPVKVVARFVMFFITPVNENATFNAAIVAITGTAALTIFSKLFAKYPMISPTGLSAGDIGR